MSTFTINGILLPYVKDGVNYETAFHRPTIKYMDIINGDMQLFIKIYASKDYCITNPKNYYTTQDIKVSPLDIATYFVPLGTGIPTSPIITVLLNFMLTINPTEQGSFYSECPFNYSQGSII